MSDTNGSATPAIVIAVIVLVLLCGGFGFLLGLVKWALILAAIVVIVGGLAWNFLGRSSDS